MSEPSRAWQPIPTPDPWALKWVGDDIGFVPERPCTVHLRNRAGAQFEYRLGDALALLSVLDVTGRERIRSCVAHSAQHGHLHADDDAAWQRHVEPMGGALGR
jgi:hypothetical protein